MHRMAIDLKGLGLPMLDQYSVHTLSCFSPSPNWFDNYSLVSFVGTNSQTINSYKLPNFIRESDVMTETQWAQAFLIRKFFKMEATSSWKNLNKIKS